MSDSVEADLPRSMSFLKNFDTLLRCPICFDYLNISMMTQCSHNCLRVKHVSATSPSAGAYLLLCIRKFLSYKLLCPLCNTPLTEQELRNNRLLDELVECFQAARQQLSQTNFESPPISPKNSLMTLGGKAARQKTLKKESTTLTHFFQKQTPINSSIGAQSHTKGLLPVKQEPMEVSVQDALLPKCTVTITTAVKEEKLDGPVFPSTSQDIKPVVKVECPVCSIQVSQHHVNKHLDTCLSRGEKKDSLRRYQKRKPMAKLVYTLLTMMELKRRLRQCHLSIQGSREQLIRRHQEFTHIYNAQCDALNPRPSEDIAREVENNEKMRNQLGSRHKPAILITKDHTADEIEQLHSDYRKQHSSEFSRLIAQVKGRLKNSSGTQIKHEEGKTEEESCCGADDQVIQNSTQPPVSLTSEITNIEKPPVMEIWPRSPSPSLSEASVSSSISDVFL